MVKCDLRESIIPGQAILQKGNPKILPEPKRKLPGAGKASRAAAVGSGIRTVEPRLAGIISYHSKNFGLVLGTSSGIAEETTEGSRHTT